MPPPKARLATVRTLLDPEPSNEDVREAATANNVLDSEALLLYFPAPKTVTGEDVLELHVHGGTATVKAVLAAIPRCRTASGARVRYAEPGEFTKRAFVHGRLDLAQIESLSDTLEAETEQQRRAAVRGSSGNLGRTYQEWRQRLLTARGELEALIDFSEDQHFDEPQSVLLENVASQAARILGAMDAHELGGQRGELLRRGIRIALVGPPNVGKSSLMNIMVGREASIVSGEAGTTRDIVEASLDIGGYPCSFADTAGLRGGSGDGDGEVVGAVEQEGIRRARKRAQESDVVVVMASVEPGPSLCLDRGTLALASEAQAALVVVNKSDRVDGSTLSGLVERLRHELGDKFPAMAAQVGSPISISCKADIGIQDVVAALVSRFSDMTDMPPGMRDLLGVTARQRQLLAKCRMHLEDFMDEAQGSGEGEDGGPDADIVLAAEYLRYAADCLARITGQGEAGDVEEVLGVVFAKFCVGK